MIHPHNKQQNSVNGDSTTTYKEEVLFNSDTLSKVISYLPSVDVLNLAITCKRFGISDVDEQSLIEKSTRIAIQDLATEEQLAALPHYEGENILADYHYLHLMREPLTFDQLTGGAEYGGDKSCVTVSNMDGIGATALSNNILRAGKHYASFQRTGSGNVMVGIMRPGQANQNASGLPLWDKFYSNFSRRLGHEECNNNVRCCLYNAVNGLCFTSDWPNPYVHKPGVSWDGMESLSYGWHGGTRGMESMSSDGEIGMLLDFNEGALSVYKNGRRLGVMKRGLADPYCWVVSLRRGTKVTIKRGTIPPS